jgi:hypothetical protein
VVRFVKGVRNQINTALIPCQSCSSGLGGSYSFIVPKHKSGAGIFVELVHTSGVVSTYGPAVKQ